LELANFEASKELSDEQKEVVCKKREQLFKLLMLRAANFVEKTSQARPVNDQHVKGMEPKDRLAEVTLKLSLGNIQFHGSDDDESGGSANTSNLDVPAAVDPVFFDDETNMNLIAELSTNWPCI